GWRTGAAPPRGGAGGRGRGGKPDLGAPTPRGRGFLSPPPPRGGVRPESHMSRRKIVAGNWKMNTTLPEAIALAEGVAKGVGTGNPWVDVAVCPPFPWLLPVRDALKGSAAALRAADAHYGKKGAYTREVRPAMLLGSGRD